MYLVLFALLTVVGSWAAWRSNPLYSAGATLRFVAVAGLAIVAVIAAIVAAVNLTSHSSQTVVLVTMFATTLLGTVALIWVIVAISTPAVAALPSATTLVHVHRAKLYPWVRRFGWTLLALILLAIALPGDWKDVAYTLGGMIVFVGIIMLFAGYIAALNFDRSLTSVEAKPWFHWRYTAEQWRTWSDIELTRMQAKPAQWVWRRDGKRLIVPALAVAAAVYFLDPGDWLWKTAYLCGLGIVMVAFIALSNHYAKTAPNRFHRLLTNAAAETYFGEAGVFADGIYTQWQTIGEYLLEATVDERMPRSLTFAFEKIMPGASPSVRVDRNVLIADGVDGDIARLQTLLSAACPSANVRLH